MPTSALVLNSTNVVGSNNTVFRYNFINGAFQVNEDSEICVASVVIPYSFFNVNAQLYVNNVFGYTFPNASTFVGSIALTTLTVASITNGTILVGMTLSGGGTTIGTIISSQISGPTGGVGTYTINISQTASPTSGLIQTSYTVTLPNGFYQVSDINSFLQNTFITRGQYLVNSTTLQNVYFISLTTNTTYYSNQLITSVLPTVITGFTNPSNMGLPATPITPQFQVLSNYPNFGTLIGYLAGIYPAVPSTTTVNFNSNTTPNLTTVNSVIMRCNLVNNPCAMPSDILASFPITAQFGSNINFSPSYEMFVGLQAGRYSALSITFQDQNFNTIQSNDPNILITLLIKQNKKEEPKKQIANFAFSAGSR